MGFLENLENNMFKNTHTDGPEGIEKIEMDGGKTIEKDAMGREKIWVENDGLALKVFTGICCSQCMCKHEV